MVLQGSSISGHAGAPAASSGTFSPPSSDGGALGTTSLMWSDLFLASAGVVNWNNGDVTLTHAANTLTVGGGDALIANGFGLIVGHTGQETVSTDGGTDLVPELQILGTTAADSSMLLATFSTTATVAAAPTIALAKGGHATIGSHTVVTDDEVLGTITAYGDDGTDIESIAAQIKFEVDGRPGTGDMPGRIILGTSADGAEAPTERVRIDTKGRLFINDNANAKMTLGLTINQNDETDEILAFKSSETAHGVTGFAETDTFGFFMRESDGDAGLRMRGVSEATVGIKISGVSTADDTAKTTSAIGNIVLDTRKKDGTGSNVVGTNGNCVTINNGTAARFIFDTEGSGHADVEWVAFDSYDDIALINDIEDELRSIESPKGTAHRQMLEATGIIGKDSWHIENGKPRAMVNMTKLAMLHHGALMQVGERIEALEAENTELRALVGGK